MWESAELKSGCLWGVENTVVAFRIIWFFYTNCIVTKWKVEIFLKLAKESNKIKIIRAATIVVS